MGEIAPGTRIEETEVKTDPRSKQIVAANFIVIRIGKVTELGVSLYRNEDVHFPIQVIVIIFSLFLI